MKVKELFYFIIVSWIIAVLPGCGGDETIVHNAIFVKCDAGGEHEEGSELGPCHKDKSCDKGLTCASGICVKIGGNDGGEEEDAEEEDANEEEDAEEKDTEEEDRDAGEKTTKPACRTAKAKNAGTTDAGISAANATLCRTDLR